MLNFRGHWLQMATKVQTLLERMKHHRNPVQTGVRCFFLVLFQTDQGSERAGTAVRCPSQQVPRGAGTPTAACIPGAYRAFAAATGHTIWLKTVILPG